jgi:thiol-disulfide isomerase/thioredoxin
MAALTGRTLIGIEMAIGILLVAHLFGNRKWILKSAIALVLIFSVYLVYLWVSVGNDINCGCFGDAIWMSPSASLLKNAGLIAGLLILLKYSKGIQFKFSTYITWIILLALTITPFIYYPLPETKPQWLNKGRFQLNISTLYTPDKADKPQVDLRKGKYILAFFSSTCPHCRMAALKLHIMKERDPSLPIFMVIGGVSNEHMSDFFHETHAQNIPYCRLKSDDFTGLVGYSWPVIYYMNNGWVEAQTNYIEMSQSSIEEWLNKP